LFTIICINDWKGLQKNENILLFTVQQIEIYGNIKTLNYVSLTEVIFGLSNITVVQ
jgi:hypothetical protein